MWDGAAEGQVVRCMRWKSYAEIGVEIALPLVYLQQDPSSFE